MITSRQLLTAEQNGISYQTLNKRLKRGWSMSQAITIPTDAHRLVTDEQIQQAKENGISYKTLHKRIAEYGWDVETAISTPVQPKFGHKKRVLDPALIDRASANGIGYYTLYDRINKWGWNAEKAATTPPRKRRKVHAGR
jgi:hypothetical protein